MIVNLNLFERNKDSTEANNPEKITLYQKSKCWACGLYQTEANLCLNCHDCTQWTKNQIHTISSRN
jgi:hypothetical protein